MTTRQMHPEAAERVQMLTSLAPVKLPWDGGSLDDLRQAKASLCFDEPFDYSGDRSDIVVPTAGGDVPVYVYVPEPCPQTAPVLIYFHGGGLVFGSRKEVDLTCKMLSQRAQCAIVSPEYRLAPEFPFPAPFDDACDVTKWVLANKKKCGVAAGSAVGVGGDSAGSQLAASVCHSVPGLAFQLLVYPRVGPPSEYLLPSYVEHEVDHILPRKLIEWFDEQYCPAGEERNPRIASLLQPSFQHLPPALLLPAHIDPIRSDSYEYHAKLTEAGVQSELHEVIGSIHGFFTKPGHYKQLTEEAYRLSADFINKYGRSSA